MTKPASRPFDTFSPAHHGLYLDNFELKDDDEDNDDGGGRDDDDLRWASTPFVLIDMYIFQSSNEKLSLKSMSS